MAFKLRLSALQMSSVPDVDANLATISEQLARLIESRNEQEDLVVLPECCLFLVVKTVISCHWLKRQSRQLSRTLPSLMMQYLG